MKYFSKNFSSLLESMKSSNPISEDKRSERLDRSSDKTSSGMSSRREARKQGRFESDFINGDTFELGSFIKALVLLRDQIVGQETAIQSVLLSKGLGSKYGAPTLRSFSTLYQNVKSLVTGATSLSKTEGKALSLSDSKDEGFIKTYREQYTQYLADYDRLSKEWLNNQKKETEEIPVDNNNREIEKAINSALDFFDKAKTALIQNSTSFIAQPVSDGGKTTDDKSQGGGSGSLTTTLKQKSDAYTGAEGDVVMEVKKLIYNNFKKYSKLSSSADWKAVYKNWPTVSGSLRTNTANVIKAVKAGLAGDYKDLSTDKTGDITPKFLEILKGLKENLSSDYGKIVSFESFMKRRVNEAFDEDAAATVISSGSSVKSKSTTKGDTGKKVESPAEKYSATPFKTDEESNKFREWVIKNKPDWAKSNSLDATGPRDNSFIRKAYTEFGKDYVAAKDVKVPTKKLTNSQLDLVRKAMKGAGWTAEIKITTDTSEPYVSFWKGKEYGGLFSNFRITYVTSAGKKFIGTIIGDKENKEIKFDNGKKITLLEFMKGNLGDKISAESASTAQGKKAYIAKSGEGYVNVRSSAMADNKDNLLYGGKSNNLIYKHTDKNTPIGLLISSTVTKSSKIGDKTWYKIQFPTKRGNFEYGYVRADTVDLK